MVRNHLLSASTLIKLPRRLEARVNIDTGFLGWFLYIRLTSGLFESSVDVFTHIRDSFQLIKEKFLWSREYILWPGWRPNIMFFFLFFLSSDNSFWNKIGDLVSFLLPLLQAHLNMFLLCEGRYLRFGELWSRVCRTWSQSQEIWFRTSVCTLSLF